MIMVMALGLASSAFAVDDPASATETPNQIPGTGMSINLSQQNSATCALIDFEGGGNQVPVGFIPNAISDATFANNLETWIDFDEGGSGSFANEPSPDTAMILNFQSGPGIMTLATPIDEIHFFYSSLIPGTQVRVFDSSNVEIVTIPLSMTPFGPGDPTGDNFGTWVFISFNDPSGDISSVEFTGSFAAGRTFYDNLELCIIDDKVGGEFMSIDSTALVLAGLQSSAIWMLPVLAGAVGVGAYYIKTRMNKDN